MARSVVGRAVVVREKYFWPESQLNIWNIVILAGAGTILGVFAEFMNIQNRMRIGTPWYVSTSPVPVPRSLRVLRQETGNATAIKQQEDNETEDEIVVFIG